MPSLKFMKRAWLAHFARLTGSGAQCILLLLRQMNAALFEEIRMKFKQRKSSAAAQRKSRRPGWMGVVVVGAAIGAAWVWNGWRIEPESGQIAVLLKKTGRNLPAGEVIAVRPEFKGVQLEVLAEGRFFRNPYVWGWSIEKATDIPAGKFGVLVRKFGKDLPDGGIIAPDEYHKGIVREVLGTGKHRINTRAYEVRLFDDIKIAPGHVGVVTRLTGRDILAGAGGAGTAGEGAAGEGANAAAGNTGSTGSTGNTASGANAAAGNAGNTGSTGNSANAADGAAAGIANSAAAGTANAASGAAANAANSAAADGAGFIVGEGEKGVIAGTLKEGTHRLNPYLFAVSIVNIQSQRFEFSGEDAILFLTLDGFPVTVEGTLEFNLNQDRAALLTHEVGDMDDIMQKIILPCAFGFFRIEGSKKTATEFIVGESRQSFQDSLESYLRGACTNWGISLNSVLIRDIQVPQEIAGIIRDREMAAQESLKLAQQIIQAKSQAELGRQKALAVQNREKVAAQTEKIRQTIAAEQAKAEQSIAAKTLLDVSTVDLESAKADAQALLVLAEAQRLVVEAGNKADADVLARHAAAFGDDAAFIRAKLYEKAAPNIESVISPADGGGLFGLPMGADCSHGAPSP